LARIRAMRGEIPESLYHDAEADDTRPNQEPENPAGSMKREGEKTRGKVHFASPVFADGAARRGQRCACGGERDRMGDSAGPGGVLGELAIPNCPCDRNQQERSRRFHVDETPRDAERVTGKSEET